MTINGSSDSIQALVLHGAKDLRFESRPVPQPSQDEVQVSIQATGLCGSDLHYYTHGRNGNFVLQHPLVLGHEASGIVTATPPPNPTTTNGTSTTSPSSLQVGDRVALEVGLPCRSCPLCMTGRYNLCPTLRFKSSAKTHPHLDGTLQTTITHPSPLCHKLPPTVTFLEGALIEPLSVSLHAVNRSVSAGSSSSSTPLPGSTALVIGAGAVGILTAITLSVSGVSNILIVDIDAPRLHIASTISSNRFNLHTYLLPRTKPPTEITDQLTAATELAGQLTEHARVPFGFDRVFECTGLPSCVQLSIFAAAPGAKVVLVGMGNPVQTLPLGAAALREVDIVGVFRYANCYPAAIQLFASGQLAGVAEALVTHRVELENGEKAFRLAANQAREGEDEGRTVVKVVVVP